MNRETPRRRTRPAAAVPLALSLAVIGAMGAMGAMGVSPAVIRILDSFASSLCLALPGGSAALRSPPGHPVESPRSRGPDARGRRA